MTSQIREQKLVYMEKEQDALDHLESLGAYMSGTPTAPVLILKGSLTETDKQQGLLSGADGVALRKSLNALGYAPEDWVALSTAMQNGTPLDRSVFKLAVINAAPQVILICDGAAQEVFRNVFASELAAIPNLDDALLSPGKVVQLLGMRVMYLGGFEESLTDDAAKRIMWMRLKQLTPRTFL